MVNKELRKEAYLEPHQTFKMDLFKEIVNGFKSLKIFEKSFILDAGRSSQYTSEDKTNISYPFSEAYPEHRTTFEIKVAAKMVNDLNLDRCEDLKIVITNVPAPMKRYETMSGQ